MEREGKQVQLSIDLAVQISAMVLMCLVGYCLCKGGVVDATHSHVLSRVAAYAAAPCAITQSFQSEFNYQQLSGLAMVAVSAVLIHLVAMAVGRGLRRSKLGFTVEESGSVIYSNAGNLGIPLITGLAALGPGYVFYLGGFIAVQSTLLWSHGVSLMSGQPQMDMKKILKHPCMVAVAVGLFLFFSQMPLPVPIQTAISSLAACLAPLCMLVIGMSLSNQDLKKMFAIKRVYGVIAIRLLVLPTLVMGVLLVMGMVWPLDDIHNILIVCFICAIGPSASTVVQLAQIFDSPNVAYASVVNVVSTVLCAITMPVMLFFFQGVLSWL